MAREVITLQVGQCGNQIGQKFWEMALREHAEYNKTGVFDDSLNAIFRNMDTSVEPYESIPLRDGKQPIHNLKARAILVDMEEGVLASTLKSPLGPLFDQNLLLNDVSGCGNNWAHGYYEYGPQYQAQLSDKIRYAIEACNNAQGCILCHSLGGGTGSGLGSFLLELLEEEYPDLLRLCLSVFPQQSTDDVATSPYNTMLALSKLLCSADMVLPLHNDALFSMCKNIEKERAKGVKRTVIGGKGEGTSPFSQANSLAAQLFLHITSCVRHTGPLHIDLSDLPTNLVPYPRLNMCCPALSPYVTYKDVALQAPPGGARRGVPTRVTDQIFQDLNDPGHHLCNGDVRDGVTLGCAVMLRGHVAVSDVQRNINKLSKNRKWTHWNPQAIKIGLCDTPPVSSQLAALALTNSTCAREPLQDIYDKFNKLYKRKVYVHHYTQYMEDSVFKESSEIVQDVYSNYEMLQNMEPLQNIPRYKAYRTFC